MRQQRGRNRSVFVTLGQWLGRFFGSRPSHDDAWSDGPSEGSFWDVVDPISVAANLRIEYRDIQGKNTKRTVAVRQIGALSGNYLMIGHCGLRDATRTFRVDRIKSCIDVDTGEVVIDVAKHLRGKFDASPDRAAEKLREAELDTLKILFFLGKADGQLRAAETAIIRETGHRLLNDSRLTDKMIDTVLREFGAPSLQAFKLAVGRVSKRPDQARAAVVDAARRMVATQSTVAPAEADALAYIEKRLTA